VVILQAAWCCALNAGAARVVCPETGCLRARIVHFVMPAARPFSPPQPQSSPHD
jgi:hypothetical protein